MEIQTWYEAVPNPPRITPVRVLRETPHTIVLAECSPANARRRKIDGYHRTYEGAYTALLTAVYARQFRLQRELQDVTYKELQAVRQLAPQPSTTKAGYRHEGMAVVGALVQEGGTS